MARAALTREESKAITRRRLLEAALELAAEGGEDITPSAVARRAGVAQPTFYVHFRDRDDLWKAVGEARIGELREHLRRSRQAIDLDALASGRAEDALRAAFRTSLEAIVDYPVLFRVYVRERLQPATELGRQCHDTWRVLRDALAEDLAVLDRHVDRQRPEHFYLVVADAITGMTEALGLGCIDGTYEDLDEMTEVLVRLYQGVMD
jgi:AcrR family transcriptional regulator